MIQCTGCKTKVYLESALNQVEGEAYCPRCYAIHTRNCQVCGERMLKHGSAQVCDNCIKGSQDRGYKEKCIKLEIKIIKLEEEIKWLKQCRFQLQDRCLDQEDEIESLKNKLFSCITYKLW